MRSVVYFPELRCGETVVPAYAAAGAAAPLNVDGGERVAFKRIDGEERLGGRLALSVARPGMRACERVR